MNDFLSHGIVLAVKELVPGCQGGRPAAITSLSIWLPTEKALAGSPSLPTSFAPSCHALPEQVFLFDVLLVLCGFFFFFFYCCFIFLHLLAVEDTDWC